ncbi:COG4315 family predicted lipoprotein [Nocardia australiensis]|uniref:COG4315 family predicted lipoprotein n=1 Tax=Nocardia australiensis TaxID=2887191 RepID=UPI001D14E41F|nr:hypothetical protein [Nocardia australiensis]
MKVQRYVLAGLAAIGLAVTSACSSTDDAAAASTTPESPQSVSATSVPAAADNHTIGVTSLGGREVLVDEAGRALYLFTKDAAGVSACSGECLVKWPVLAGPVTAGAGADPAAISTITRPDGGSQATYAGKPLYYFAADAAPGDTRGQGAMDVWYLVGADGEAVR